MIPKALQADARNLSGIDAGVRVVRRGGEALAGPLTKREVALVKLAISIGAGLEGATHSHCRKALEAGCTPGEVRHVAVVSAPTIGFPTMMRARSWVEDVLEKPVANLTTHPQ